MIHGTLDSRAAAGLACFLFLSMGHAHGQGAAQGATTLQKLLASDGAENDLFGYFVSLSGTRALLGAPASLVGSNPGEAHVFEAQPGGSWSETAILEASDPTPSAAFGASGALAGDQAWIGSPQHSGPLTYSGAAYAFERQANGTWIQVAQFLGENGSEYFGNAIALEPDRALVGALNAVGIGYATGAVYVFERQASGPWIETAKLVASDGVPYNQFGASVSLSVDRALIGSSDDAQRGSAYLFERQSGAGWVEVAKLLPSDPGGGDFFGYSVALSGTRALIGAPFDNISAPDSGSAYVFERQPGGEWVQTAKLVSSGAGRCASFGNSVSLAGTRALIGAPFEAEFRGIAHVFERRPSGIWSEVRRFAGPPSFTAFGLSVSLGGSGIVVGAPYDDDLGALSGSAFAFLAGR